MFIFIMEDAKIILHFIAISGVLNNLFDGLSDKDETVRMAIQAALVKIIETHPVRATEILFEYREKHPKLNEQTTTIILK